MAEQLNQNNRFKVIDFGKANYKFDEKKSMSFYLKLEREGQERTLWGKELEKEIQNKNLQKGEYIYSAKRINKEHVIVKTNIYDDKGKFLKEEKINAYRNKWEILKEKPIKKDLLKALNDYYDSTKTKDKNISQEEENKLKFNYINFIGKWEKQDDNDKNIFHINEEYRHLIPKNIDTNKDKNAEFKLSLNPVFTKILKTDLEIKELKYSMQQLPENIKKNIEELKQTKQNSIDNFNKRDLDKEIEEMYQEQDYEHEDKLNEYPIKSEIEDLIREYHKNELDKIDDKIYNNEKLLPKNKEEEKQVNFNYLKRIGTWNKEKNNAFIIKPEYRALACEELKKSDINKDKFAEFKIAMSKDYQKNLNSYLDKKLEQNKEKVQNMDLNLKKTQEQELA